MCYKLWKLVESRQSYWEIKTVCSVLPHPVCATCDDDVWRRWQRPQWLLQRRQLLLQRQLQLWRHQTNPTDLTLCYLQKQHLLNQTNTIFFYTISFVKSSLNTTPCKRSILRSNKTFWGAPRSLPGTPLPLVRSACFATATVLFNYL